MSSSPADQLAHQRSADELAAVLGQIDWALERGVRARQVVAADGVDRNAELALAAAIEGLQRLRARFLKAGQ